MANMTVRRTGGTWPEERPFWVGASAVTHVLLRLGVALLFVQHSGQKLLGWFGGLNGQGLAAPVASLFGAAGVIELIGGVLLLIGLLTRPVTMVLAAEMTVAYVLVHAPRGGLPIQNQGELAVLYGLIFLYFFGSGAGRLSIDHWLAHRDTNEGRTGTVDRERVQPDEDEPKRRGHAA